MFTVQEARQEAGNTLESSRVNTLQLTLLACDLRSLL